VPDSRLFIGLDPPLAELPKTDWFCFFCKPKRPTDGLIASAWTNHQNSTLTRLVQRAQQQGAWPADSQAADGDANADRAGLNSAGEPTAGSWDGIARALNHACGTAYSALGCQKRWFDPPVASNSLSLEERAGQSRQQSGSPVEAPPIVETEQPGAAPNMCRFCRQSFAGEAGLAQHISTWHGSLVNNRALLTLEALSGFYPPGSPDPVLLEAPD